VTRLGRPERGAGAPAGGSGVGRREIDAAGDRRARDRLIERTRRRLAGRSFPRLQMAAMLAAAGGTAFVFSALTMRSGLTAMPLLAAVAVDAAIVSLVYRRVRRHEQRGHWVHGLVRRTWLPAAGIAGCAAALGWVLQHAVPEARSIGGALRVLTTAERVPTRAGER
jgi:hypothetical protein